MNNHAEPDYPKQDFFYDFSEVMVWQSSRLYAPQDAQWQHDFIANLQRKYPPGEVLALRGEILTKTLHTILALQRELASAHLFEDTPDRTHKRLAVGVYAALYEHFVEQRQSGMPDASFLVKRATHLQGEHFPQNLGG